MSKKGQNQRKYSPEFKISVIMDMREHHCVYVPSGAGRYWHVFDFEDDTLTIVNNIQTTAPTL
ncbi:MAG: hypothetical protein J6D27_09680 [Ruminiclostridium sp.]|nr:hypothetical protein [Ruminiclostridium sp.]MBQ5320056.1 hypothetical protein [Oscillospiraceae bacterium]